MLSSYKQKMIDYYEGLLDQYGDSWRSLDWKSEESQKIRFAVLFSIVSLFNKTSNISILDVGCGLGHLYQFLRDEGFMKKYKIDYTGYDISSKFLEIAKRKFPEARFEIKDILADRSPKKFDYVFCSGVFNILFSDSVEHDSFVKKMILKMYELCNLGAAVNFLSASAIYLIPQKEEQELRKYYYFKPEDIIEYIRSITSRFILRQDYHPGDFTIYLLKDLGPKDIK